MIGDDGLPLGPFASPEPDLPWPPPGWPGSMAAPPPDLGAPFPSGAPIPQLDFAAPPVPDLAGPIVPPGVDIPLPLDGFGAPPFAADAEPVPGGVDIPPPLEFGSPFAPGPPPGPPDQGPGILDRIGAGIDHRVQPLLDAAGREASYRGTARELNANPFDEGGDIRADLNPQDTQRYFNELYTRNPVKAQELESTLRARREQYIADRQRQIQKDDMDAQRRAIADYQTAQASVAKRRAAIDADVERLSQAKVDPMAGISTGQSIAGIVGAIVGGLYQARHGGENTGLNSWMSLINRNIETQRANIANQREGLSMKQNALAREVADHGDTYRASEAMRKLALRQMDDQLAAAQLNFAPRGTTFMRIAKDRAQIAANIAAQNQKSDQKAFEDSLRLNDAYRQERTIAETERNNRAQNYLRAKEIEETAANRAETRAGRVDAKTAKAEADRQKLELERSIAGEVTPVKDDQGNVVGRTLGPITNSKGDVWIPTGTDPQISKLQDQHVATLKYLGTIDEIRRLGPEYLTDVGNSEKLQRMKQLAGTARLQAIAMNGLGVPTGHDVELADTFVGTSDPTKLRSSLAGLMQGRETAVRNHNMALKAHGLDKTWNPPDLGGTQRVDIANADNTALKRRGSGNPDDIYRDEFARQGAALGVPRAPGGELLWSQRPGAAEQAKAAATSAVDEYKATGITPAQRAGVGKLRAQAEGGDQSAIAALTNLAAQGQANAKGVRQLAQEALNRVEMARRTGAPGPSTDADVPVGAFTAPTSPTFPDGR